MSRRLSRAYLAGSPEAAVFLPGGYQDGSSRAAAVAAAGGRAVSPFTREALAANSAPELVERLASGAVAVVTGQQVGLFLGPLYTLYKALTACRVAETIRTETGLDAVPVFWIQDEDHDREEIAEAYLPSAGAPPLRISLPDDGLARVPVAHRRLPRAVDAQLRAVADNLAPFPHQEEVRAALRAAYAPGRTWSEAFIALLREVLGDRLAILDPRHPALRVAARPLHTRALEQASRWSKLLVARAEAIEAAGFAAPVHVRPDAPLCFFHPAGEEGPRYRLAPAGELYRLVGEGGTVSREELQARLEEKAGCFTTSALLRPLLQDWLLPTAAYVAGPGEIDYFAQLPPLYDALEIPMPIIVPRARFCLVEPKVEKALRRLGLTFEVAASAPDLAAHVRQLAHDPRPERLRTQLLEPFEAALAAAAREAEDLPGLDRAFEKTVRSVRRSVETLVEKYRNAALHTGAGAVRDLEMIENALRPYGLPQERVLSLPYFWARYGRTVVDRIDEAIEPFDGREKELHL